MAASKKDIDTLLLLIEGEKLARQSGEGDNHSLSHNVFIRRSEENTPPDESRWAVYGSN